MESASETLDKVNISSVNNSIIQNPHINASDYSSNYENDIQESGTHVDINNTMEYQEVLRTSLTRFPSSTEYENTDNVMNLDSDLPAKSSGFVLNGDFPATFQKDHFENGLTELFADNEDLTIAETSTTYSHDEDYTEIEGIELLDKPLEDQSDYIHPLSPPTRLLVPVLNIAAASSSSSSSSSSGGGTSSVQTETPLSGYDKFVRMIQHPSRLTSGVLDVVNTAGVFGGIVSLSFLLPLVGKKRKRRNLPSETYILSEETRRNNILDESIERFILHQ